MCKNSILIRNPKVESPHYVEGVDARYLMCPCGHCEDCKKRKRNSVYTRLYYEYQDCLALGGYCINLTLTYNNEHLPTISYDGQEWPCFRTSDVQKYIKRVRKFYSDRGQDIYFTYFASMELGGTTHRPHYHMLFFVKQRGTSMCQFIRVVREKWTNGFTSVGCLGAWVKNPRMLNYAAKYVAKDLVEDEWYQPLIKFLRKKCDDMKQDAFDMGDNELSQFDDLYKYYKRCLSGRFLASRGLGLYALKVCDAKLLREQKITVPSADGFQTVALPQYLDRKLHYEVLYRDRLTGIMSEKRRNKDDVPTYVLNMEGMRFCQTRFKTKLEFLTNRLKEFINTSYNNDSIELICRSLTNMSLSEVRGLFKGQNLERVAAYEILYLHRRDYGIAYDEPITVTADDMMCDYMTLCNSSVHMLVGEIGAKSSLAKLYSAPYSRDLNIQQYRINASYMQHELKVFDARIFSFISWYLSECNKRTYQMNCDVSKAKVYRKSLAFSLVS